MFSAPSLKSVLKKKMQTPVCFVLFFVKPLSLLISTGTVSFRIRAPRHPAQNRHLGLLQINQDMRPAILVISNPVSGDRNGCQFVEENVLPLFRIQDLPYELEETRGVGAAGSLALQFLQKHENESNVALVLVISGGDGTVHEVVNGIGIPSRAIQLVLCPQGTANALYSTLFPPSNDGLSTLEYRTKSLRAFLDGRSRPLMLAETKLITTDGQVTRTLLGVVVTSTALHASILDSAEHLRTSISGIERFQVAAMENRSNWYQSHVRLYPSVPGGTVQTYDPSVGAFKRLNPSRQSEVDLHGPFAYFLSTVNVDRLEPNFETSPLFVKLPPGPGEMDLIVIRPLRDPSLELDMPESRAAFTQKLFAVLQEAYNHGNHLALRYHEDGSVTSAGNGPYVVEYFRCGGWEWVPVRIIQPISAVPTKTPFF